ncbi:MAG: ABC transporter substrate-binding protein [Lachnospiraceae bacterium]|nr:ABC transporter substrate-binding protein [Lachnospiraceae bacterium]
MKNMKKVLSAALVAAMSFTMLTGCGNSNKTSDTWKFGGIGPATGDYAAYGIGVRNGIELAVNEINENGGINGVPIEYKFEDDQTDNEKSVNGYNALKDWGMNVLIGSTTSGCSIAVADVSSQDHMFQLTPSASSIDAVKTDNTFQVCFTDPSQGFGSAQYIGDHGLATKVAILHNSSDVYSTGIYETFVAEAANQPFEIVADEAFTDDSKTDFTVQLTKAKEAGAELLFLPMYYTEAALILTQANTMDYAPIFFGVDGMDGILGNVDGFDTALAEGVVLLTPFAADAPEAVDFTAAYEAAYGITPNQFAADAYDAVYILKQLIEESGATPQDGIPTICDKLTAQILVTSFTGMTGENITWSESGEVNKYPKAMQIVNGSYTLFK